MVRISPSLLSADPYDLRSDIRRVMAMGMDMLHVDVMDGHFVPNITYGIPLVKGLRKHLDLDLDVHLMISDPDRYAPMFARAGADIVTVHVEASNHLNRTLSAVREEEALAGITLNPHTSLEELRWSLEYCDMVLVMSVNPGFGGQSFIESSLERIAALKEMMEEIGVEIPIEVDGGMDPVTAPLAVAAGADIIVAGSAVFSADDGNIEGNIKALQESIKLGPDRSG
ncbi:MAG: ribulose-phosphate 3-epimerase [Thermoplasmatota archaeon]